MTSHSKWVMHLLQVHLKWANVWLLVVSAVIVAVSTVVAHFLQVVPCSTSATVSQIVKLTAKGFSHKEKHRFGCYTVKNFQRLRMKRDSLYHIQQQILIPPGEIQRLRYHSIQLKIKVSEKTKIDSLYYMN